MARPGWIKFWRESLDHWVVKRPLCTGLAWFYLVAWAAFEEEQRHFMGRVWKLARGTHVTTCRQLARDWGWDHKKVGRYLKTLQQADMIRPTNSPPCIVVTICNYDTWQSDDSKRPTERPQTPQQLPQARPSDAPATPHEGRREELQEGKKSTTRGVDVVATLEAALPNRPDPLAPPRVCQKARDFIANFKDDATKLHVTEFIGIMEADGAIPEHRIVGVVRELWNARQGLNIEAENLPQDKLFNYALEESMKRGVRQVSYVKSVLRNGIMKLREGIKPWNHHAKT